MNCIVCGQEILGTPYVPLMVSHVIGSKPMEYIDTKPTTSGIHLWHLTPMFNEVKP